jgi:hypothetical protein
MFVIPGTNIGGDAGSFLSWLVLPSVSAYRWDSYLLVIVRWVEWSFVSCGLFFILLIFFWIWGLFFSYLFRRLPARTAGRHCRRSRFILLLFRSLPFALTLCWGCCCLGCMNNVIDSLRLYGYFRHICSLMCYLLSVESLLLSGARQVKSWTHSLLKFVTREYLVNTQQSKQLAFGCVYYKMFCILKLQKWVFRKFVSIRKTVYLTVENYICT